MTLHSCGEDETFTEQNEARYVAYSYRISEDIANPILWLPFVSALNVQI